MCSQSSHQSSILNVSEEDNMDQLLRTNIIITSQPITELSTTTTIYNRLTTRQRARQRQRKRRQERQRQQLVERLRHQLNLTDEQLQQILENQEIYRQYQQNRRQPLLQQQERTLLNQREIQQWQQRQEERQEERQYIRRERQQREQRGRQREEEIRQQQPAPIQPTRSMRWTDYETIREREREEDWLLEYYWSRGFTDDLDDIDEADLTESFEIDRINILSEAVQLQLYQYERSKIEDQLKTMQHNVQNIFTCLSDEEVIKLKHLKDQELEQHIDLKIQTLQ